LKSGTKYKFLYYWNLNSSNLHFHTPDVGIKIVPESQSMNLARFGFTVRGFYLAREEQNASFGA